MGLFGEDKPPDTSNPWKRVGDMLGSVGTTRRLFEFGGNIVEREALCDTKTGIPNAARDDVLRRLQAGESVTGWELFEAGLE